MQQIACSVVNMFATPFNCRRSGLRLNEGSGQLRWLRLDALSLVGPIAVQLLECCCFSVSVLVLLLSTHLCSCQC